MVKPRCPGTKTAGHWTGFVCVLDEGHAGFCQPYVPPDADEWRGVKARSAEYEARMVYWSERCMAAEADLSGAFERERYTDTTCARLQAELDALRAVVESGRDLDAEVLCSVQTQRDDLAGLARKGDA